MAQLDFEQSLVHERANCEMGATFAYSLLRQQTCDNFGGMFHVVQPQLLRVFAPFHKRLRKRDHHNTPDFKQ